MIQNCFIYNRSFDSSEKIESSTSTIYEKKLKSFSYFFTQGVNNQILKNNSAIKNCRNLDTVKIKSIKYNLVVDRYLGVFLYDSYWNYHSTFTVPNVYYGIVSNCFYYFSTFNSTYGIVKTSMNSSTTFKSYGISGVYRGLYYDLIGSKIIAAGCEVNKVDILDLDLNFISSFLMPGQCVTGVTVYNSKIYMVTWGSSAVSVISNGTIKNTYSTICSTNLAGISVDSFGYFVISCSRNSSVYLYDSNMNYTNKSIALGDAFDARLDTNSRLAICGGKNVAIYN